jgi:hypothetical protein
VPSWWSEEADAALAHAVATWGWAWEYSFGTWYADQVGTHHQAQAMAYASARARQAGLLEGVLLPEVKPCAKCGELFRKDGAAGACLQRFGDIRSIDFCNPCMAAVIVDRGEDNVASEDALRWLATVTDTIGRVPAQSFPTIADFQAADRAERLAILQLYELRPSVSAIKDMFGSWRDALIEAGLRK